VSSDSAMAEDASSGPWVSPLLWLVTLTTPAGLMAESGLRASVLPPETEELRELLGPLLTLPAWALVAVTAVAGVLALWGQHRFTARSLARADPDPDARQQAVLAVFFVTASVAQLPAIGSIVLCMFGAAWAPVVLAVGLSALGVGVQALRATRLMRRSPLRGSA
jgi:hypothetical protein